MVPTTGGGDRIELGLGKGAEIVRIAFFWLLEGSQATC
jgi:hypothetical protein